jgi:phage replication O-like protein O
MMAGVSPPNYTQIPNEILDKMADMTPAEFKVLMAICRKTFGWHKDRDVISLTQLEKMTGLSRTAVQAGIMAAIDRGLLERTEVVKGAGKQSFSYHLLVASDYQSTQTTSSKSGTDPVASDYQGLVVSDYTQKKDLNKLKESGGVAKPSQTTPPPQGQRESDEALKQYGYDAGQRRKIYAARLPLTDQEIADLPDYIAALKRAGKRNPIGIVYNELIDGKSIPHPEDVAPTEAPLEYIYTDDGRAIPKDPERHARIQAQRKAQLAAAGYR